MKLSIMRLASRSMFLAVVVLAQGCATISNNLNPPSVDTGFTAQAAEDYVNKVVAGKSGDARRLATYYRSQQIWKFLDGSSWGCNNKRYRVVELAHFLRVREGGNVDGLFLQLGDCVESQIIKAAGKFDGQYLYMYYPGFGTTYINKFKPEISGGAAILRWVGQIHLVDSIPKSIPPVMSQGGSTGKWNGGTDRDVYSMEEYMNFEVNHQGTVDLPGVIEKMKKAYVNAAEYLTEETSSFAGAAAQIRADNARVVREIDADMANLIRNQSAEMNRISSTFNQVPAPQTQTPTITLAASSQQNAAPQSPASSRVTGPKKPQRKKYSEKNFNAGGVEASTTQLAIAMGTDRVKKAAEKWVSERKYNGSIPVNGVIIESVVRCEAHGGNTLYRWCFMDFTYEADSYD